MNIGNNTSDNSDEIKHNSNEELWLAMKNYHESGLSMMWGRAEDDPAKGKKAKSPLVNTWTSEVEGRFSLSWLNRVMVKAGATVKIAPIIICGKGSGHLVVIDIDVKHMPGIDAKFFLAIQQTYPDLWKRLRIHRTPSGGYHILYRTFEYVHFTSKNPGLAYAADKKEAGIESRTHGGYVLAPPGFGYSVFQDVPIPTITVEEHEQLFALARLFNEKITIKKVRAVKAYEEIYDENPFDHYDNSPAAEKILELHGWDFDYENSQFTHYTRPGKDGGVSASYHKDKRFYHFFTTSSEFDNDHFNGNYSPVAVKCLLEANNDWKKLYVILRNEGYGKHKPGYEAKMVRKAVETGRELPANFSEEAKAQLEVAVEEKNSKYPHGIFWEYNPSNNTYSIQRTLLKRFMDNLGLRLHKKAPVIIEGQFIRKLKESKKENGEKDVYNIIMSWIREEEDEVYLSITNEFAKFWQASGEFTVTTISKLDDSLILKSNTKVCYKVFLNGILRIESDGFMLLPTMDMAPKLIWSDSVIQYEFRYIDKVQQQKSLYVDYLNKGLNGSYEYKQLCVGYLGHDSKQGEQYMICLLEPMDTALGGGTGKNQFCYMLSPWTSVLTTDAQALKRDVDQLIQNWNGERIVHLSDMSKWTDLGRLKNIITDDSQRKLLYKDITNVSKDDMPKFVLSGQHGLDTESDGGVKRRVRVISFSGYFNRAHGLRDEYGGEVPGVMDSPERMKMMGWVDADGAPVGWDERQGVFRGYDWDGYFSYLADAVKAYLGAGKLPSINDRDIWLKGFDLRYSGSDSYFRDAIEDRYEFWCEKGLIPSKEIIDWYADDVYGTKRSSRGKLGDQLLHRAIQEYGKVMKRYEYEYGNHIKREYITGVQLRVVKIKKIEGDVEGDEGWEKVSDVGEKGREE